MIVSDEAVEAAARALDPVAFLRAASDRRDDARKLVRAALTAALPHLMVGADSGGWLPIVLCPTDGKRRALRLASGREVVGEFEMGEWRVIRDVIKRPGVKLAPLGGVERTSAPYFTHVMERISSDYPTHFRPNDTVHGRPVSKPISTPSTVVGGE